MIYFTENDIDRIIEDDVPAGDMTTTLLNLKGKKASIAVFARDKMTVCCTEEAIRMYQKVGLNILNWLPSGRYIDQGEEILRAEGDAANIHLIWRTGGAMIEFASGIASRTAMLVNTAHSINPDISVAGTRKHPPYLKKIALKALIAGGGTPHRTGLSDTILIFREHLLFTGGYEHLNDVIKKIKQQQKERKIVIEAHTQKEALICAQAGADAIQMDKLDPEQFARCAFECKKINPAICMLAAGGINITNAAGYVKAGADVLVTSWIYYAPPADIRIEIKPL